MTTIIKKGTSRKEIKKRLEAVISKFPQQDILKYAGTLKTDIDPLEYQMELRNLKTSMTKFVSLQDLKYGYEHSGNKTRAS